MIGTYWDEWDTKIQNCCATRYTWPRDRVLAFLNSDNEVIIVPTFNKHDHDIEESITLHIEDGIKRWGHDNFHLHFIEINGVPDEIGLITYSEKLRPDTNFWAWKKNDATDVKTSSSDVYNWEI